MFRQTHFSDAGQIKCSSLILISKTYPLFDSPSAGKWYSGWFSTVFWDVTPYSLIEVHGRFGVE
jgi:hypothetical protein